MKETLYIYFGTYCEVHNETDPSNSMVPHTHEAIALGTAGNLQRKHKFFCFNTGRVLNRRNFTEYPIPGIVIKKVNKWGDKTS